MLVQYHDAFDVNKSTIRHFVVLDAALLKVRIVANLGKLMIQHARGLEEVPLRRSAQNEMTLIIFGELAYLI